MLEKIEKRLWCNVKIGASDECWPWLGGVDDRGYGRPMIGGVRKRAHRWALQLSTGKDMDGMSALHSCDNPICCNPAHLRWGTHQENMTDRKERGRGFRPKGTKHGASKMTEVLVRRIRFGGESVALIISETGLAKSTIYHVRQGRSWKHIGNP